MRTDLWFTVTEYACTGANQAIPFGNQVIDFQTQVMHASADVFLEKATHRRAITQGFKQFDASVWQINEDNGNPVFGQSVWFTDLDTECIAPRCRGDGQIRHHQCDVIEASSHSPPA